ISDSGLRVSTIDDMFRVILKVDNANNLKWAVVIDGVGPPETTIGTVDRTVTHKYKIQMENDATFTVLVDGQVKATGITAGPPTVWANGIAKGQLRTRASSSGNVLNTLFDNVVAR